MNHAAALTLGLLAGLALAPTITRPAPDRVRVEDSAYAYTVPMSRVLSGSEILHGVAWDEDTGSIMLAVDPLTVYEVHTFANGDGQTGDHAMHLLAPDREVVIDHIITQRIIWERAFNALADGTHPAVDGPVDYFELARSIIRVHQQLDQEGNAP